MNVTRYTEVEEITKKSRADYMRKRRAGKKTFSVLIDKAKAEAIGNKLKKENKTKAAWIEEKIEEEIKK